MEVMEISQNHLLRSRETAKTKPYVLTLLRQRWAHPRFVIRAALTEKVGLIGFGDADFIPEEIVVQLRLLGATSVERTGGVFTLSHINFHTAVWHLIDQNGWVRRLDLGAGLSVYGGAQGANQRRAYGDVNKARALVSITKAL